jgi:hypothetical protein
LFDYKQIKSISHGKSPTPIVWAVSSDGRLLGLSFVPEQEVYAWHTHSIAGGEIEYCAVIDEGDDSVPYIIVKRTIDGSTVRYIEAMASRYFADLTEYVGLDSSICYNGASTSSLSGLGHLEGEEVYALVDGAVQGPFTVSSGAITLDAPGEVICAGIRRTADAQTLPLVAEIEAFGQSTFKSIKKVTLRVYRSIRFFAGDKADRLYEAKVRTSESYGDPISLQTGEVEVAVGTDWDETGQLIVRTQDPLPLTVSSMTLHVAVGG